MGGIGSGRRKSSSLGTVECSRSIDLTCLKKQGCLRAGWEGRLNWQRDGRITGSVRIRAEQDCIQVVYQMRIGEGDWEQVTDKIAIVRVPCRYGGDRPYFVCPGKPGAACGRRVLSVFGSGRLFLCRHCSRFSYRIQSEDTAGRTRRRAIKHWRRLGGDDISVAHNRPKGMWRRTFERLIDRAIQAEMLADDEYERRAAQLEERIGR
jgi:hypothetical protein